MWNLCRLLLVFVNQVTRNDTVKITDFGVSRLKENTTAQPMTMIGMLQWGEPVLVFRSRLKLRHLHAETQLQAPSSTWPPRSAKGRILFQSISMGKLASFAREGISHAPPDQSHVRYCYRFGVVLWEMATQQKPYHDANVPRIALIY